MKEIIEIPDGYELKKDGDVYRVVKKLGRWVPRQFEDYWFVDSGGDIGKTQWQVFCYNSKRLKAGNVFKTEEDAKRSLIYFALNSEYHYWIPDMKKPKEMPDGCEYAYSDDWLKDDSKPIYWVDRPRRWPKGGQDGGLKELQSEGE